MASECYFTLFAKGTPEAIDELEARLWRYTGDDYELGIAHMPHFFGIFELSREANVVDERDGLPVASFDGTCKWSVRDCMTDEPGTLYHDMAGQPSAPYADYATSLGKTARELGLEVEVFAYGDETFEHLYYTPDGSTEIVKTSGWAFNDWDDLGDEIRMSYGWDTFSDYAAYMGYPNANEDDEIMTDPADGEIVPFYMASVA